VCLDVGDGIAGVEGLLGQVRLDLNVQLLALINDRLNLSTKQAEGRGVEGGGGGVRQGDVRRDVGDS
jgi:hypothetical protein